VPGAVILGFSIEFTNPLGNYTSRVDLHDGEHLGCVLEGRPFPSSYSLKVHTITPSRGAWHLRQVDVEIWRLMEC
jgi:hypothetical protein